MQKFRRKPEEIRAQQFNPKSNRGWPPGVRAPKAGTYVITVGSSELEVLPGDWVTFSETGSGVCRDDYFRRIYEPVE